MGVCKCCVRKGGKPPSANAKRQARAEAREQAQAEAAGDAQQGERQWRTAGRVLQLKAALRADGGDVAAAVVVADTGGAAGEEGLRACGRAALTGAPCHELHDPRSGTWSLCPLAYAIHRRAFTAALALLRLGADPAKGGARYRRPPCPRRGRAAPAAYWPQCRRSPLALALDILAGARGRVPKRERGRERGAGTLSDVVLALLASPIPAQDLAWAPLPPHPGERFDPADNATVLVGRRVSIVPSGDHAAAAFRAGAVVGVAGAGDALLLVLLDGDAAPAALPLGVCRPEGRVADSLRALAALHRHAPPLAAALLRERPDALMADAARRAGAHSAARITVRFAGGGRAFAAVSRHIPALARCNAALPPRTRLPRDVLDAVFAALCATTELCLPDA